MRRYQMGVTAGVAAAGGYAALYRLGRTRVIQRNRMRLEPAWFERAFLATIVPADFIMARSHLRGLRGRAQGSVSSPPRPAVVGRPGCTGPGRVA